jgi:hypothetical protein
MILFLCLKLQACIERTTSSREALQGVGLYATVMGRVSHTFRLMSPYASSSFHSFDKMRGVVPTSRK